jgi:hypothetical protein
VCVCVCTLSWQAHGKHAHIDALAVGSPTNIPVRVGSCGSHVEQGTGVNIRFAIDKWWWCAWWWRGAWPAAIEWGGGGGAFGASTQPQYQPTPVKQKPLPFCKQCFRFCAQNWQDLRVL